MGSRSPNGVCFTPQLVRTYFGTRQRLLDALYAREHRRFQTAIDRAFESTLSFEGVVRVFVGANVDHLGPSSALGALQAAPELTAVATMGRAIGSSAAGKVLATSMRAEFPAPTETITRILTMGSGASIAAARLASQRGSDRAETIDETVRFIMGGLEAALQRH